MVEIMTIIIHSRIYDYILLNLKERKMGLGDYATSSQKQKIYSLVYELEMKKASTKHKDIYESHIGETEYWQGLANKVTNDLLNKNVCDGFILNNGGYYIEFCDEYSKTKYKIYKDGSTEGPLEYTPWGTLRKEGAPRLLYLKLKIVVLKRYSLSAMPILRYCVPVLLSVLGTLLPFLRD